METVQFFLSRQFMLLTFIFLNNFIRLCHSDSIMFVNRGNCRVQQEPQNASYTLIQDLTVDAIQCARLCWQDDQCVGFNHPGKGTGNCTLRRESPSFTEICTESDTDDVFMQKDGICYNDGVWSQSHRSCRCAQVDLRIGDYCSSIPIACDDIMTAGYKGYIKYITVDPFGVPYRTAVRCQQDLGEKTTKARFAKFQPTSYASFNKSWDDIENGFEDDHSEWIGLKAMRYQIERVRHKSHYLSVSMDRAYQPTFKFMYHGVHLSDASDGYRLTFSHSKTESEQLTPSELAQVPDCLLESNGSRFSTFDRDMDNDVSENCALISNAAFWYNRCHPKCQPLAVSYNATSRQLFFMSKFRYSTLDLSGPHFWAGNFDRSFIDLVVKN